MQKHKVYLKNSKRYATISIYKPKSTSNLKCLYLLDGQNSFVDHNTLYNSSLRLGHIIDYLSTLNINILAIGIESDEKRNDEYSPFKIVNTMDKRLKENDISYNHNFSNDLIYSIIPYVDKLFNLKSDANNRIIYGSSLGAIEALYLGLNYDAFNYIGAFSTPSYIYDNSFFDFIKSKANLNKRIFIYVGEKEESDNEYTKDFYLESSYGLKRLLDSLKIKNKLVINKNGSHNEKSWSYYIPDFIKYTYNN